MSDKLPASVAIISGNEESRIRGCLDSVRDFEDIVVVVDGRVTDNTADVAKNHGARVFTEEWKGFGPQKQSAIDKCKYDRVLLIDTDERMTPDAINEIHRIIEKGDLASAYSFRRMSYIGYRWIRHSGWWPDRVTRFIDRRKCHMDGMIHESVRVDGKLVALESHMEHYSFRNYSEMLWKLDSYTEYTSDEVVKKGRAVSHFAPFTHALSMFIKVYFLRRGFLDGLDGLVISLLNAAGSFFKYAKVIDKMRQDGDK